MKNKLFYSAFLTGTLMAALTKAQAQWNFLAGNHVISTSDYLGTDGSSTSPLQLMTTETGANALPINFYTNNTQQMTLLGNSGSTDGYLGIGTTNPAARLEVFDNTTNPTLRLSYSGTSFADFKIDNNGNLVIYPQISGAVGQVGIGNFGAVAPLSRLEVFDNTNAQLRLSQAVSNTVGSRRFTTFKTNSNGDLRIDPSGTSGTSGGLVGIACNPNAQLEVFSTAEQLRLSYNVGSVYTSFTNDANGYLNVYPSGNRTGFNTSPAAYLDVFGNTTNLPQLQLTQTEGSVYTTFITNSSGYLKINPSGNRVGINVAPAANLDVQGTSGSTPQLALTYTPGSVYTKFFTTSAGNLNMIPSGGDVGINQASPVNTLDVNGGVHISSMPASSSGNVVVWDGSGNLTVNTGVIGASGWLLTGNTLGGGEYIGSNNAKDFLVETNGVERMRVIGTASHIGEVGIGTSSPKAKLDVEADDATYDEDHGGFFGMSGAYSGASGYTDFTGVNGDVEVSGVTGGTNVGGDFYASNASSNIGVRGTITGGSTNASTNVAVYGDAGGNLKYWAGFLIGKGYISGGAWIPSDSTFKNNIEDYSNALDQIDQLQPKSYNYDTATYSWMGLPSGEQYGFIAQDLQNVFPQFVTQTVQPASVNSAGNVIHPSESFESMNITALIPVAIAGIKELKATVDQQQAQIAALQTQLNNCCGGGMRQSNPNGGQGSDENKTMANPETINLQDYIVLDQNVPNPFAQQTTIRFVIPESVSQAQVIFYDQSGRMVNSMTIASRGPGSLNVYANDLSDGTYSYSLFADGKLIDTKKMVKQH